MVALVNKAFSLAILSYRIAQQTGQVPFWIVSVFVIYIPFEDFILKWFPLPLPVINGIRMIPEFILYWLLFKVLSERISSGKTIRKTPIDTILIIFFISSIISILINGAFQISSFMNIRTIWRYLSVYYIVVNLDISREQISKIFKYIIIIGLIQAYLASLQFFLPERVNQILFARPGTLAALGKLKEGATFGTFSDSANLSSFLLLATTVYLVSVFINSRYLIPKKIELLNILVLFFGIFATKKRAALVISLSLIILVFYYLKKNKNIVIIMWFSGILALLGVILFPLFDLVTTTNYSSSENLDLMSYFTEIFSPKYWQETASQSRIFVIIQVCTALIKSGSWFGFGPSLWAAYNGISNTLFLSSGEERHLWRVLYVFEDPYWFAVLGYFGIIGLLLFWFVLWHLHRASKLLIRFSLFKEYKTLGVMFCTFTVSAYFYSFVERIFVLRGFSFYYWLLAGLVINACYAEKRKKKAM
jgi:hypothetical protein